MLRYEMKKFFSKTINKVILTVLLLVTIILGFLAAGNIFYADMEGKKGLQVRLNTDTEIGLPLKSTL